VTDGRDHILDGIVILDTPDRGPQDIAAQLATLDVSTPLVKTDPGLGVHASAVSVAEIGVTPAAFPSVALVNAWVDSAPGSNQGAGKRKAARTPPYQRRLRTALVSLAGATVRERDT
jgi:transposase